MKSVFPLFVNPTRNSTQLPAGNSAEKKLRKELDLKTNKNQNNLITDVVRWIVKKKITQSGEGCIDGFGEENSRVSVGGRSRGLLLDLVFRQHARIVTLDVDDVIRGIVFLRERDTCKKMFTYKL